MTRDGLYGIPCDKPWFEVRKGVAHGPACPALGRQP